jgi:taurine dioxygenase
MEESERIASLIPEMLHPLVCTHPETGHPHLYLSPRFTTRIEGLTEEISAALLKNLFEFMEDPRFIYRHTWREKDLVIWDNRRLNHRVLSYPADDIRCRQRVTILGEPVSGYSVADGQADRLNPAS